LKIIEAAAKKLAAVFYFCQSYYYDFHPLPPPAGDIERRSMIYSRKYYEKG
jgi:hypothetical protein